MQAKEFLLEYDRSREQQRIEQLPAYAQRIEEDPEFSLEKLESIDPTPQKSYVPRLAQWWMKGESINKLLKPIYVKFNGVWYHYWLSAALDKFHKLKKKNLIKPEHSDIGKFTDSTQFCTALIAYKQLPEEPETKTVLNDNEVQIVQLLNRAAAERYGIGCIASRDPDDKKFEEYIEEGPIYVIRVKSSPPKKYQFWFDEESPSTAEFMDINNDPVNPRSLPIYDKLQQFFAPLHKFDMMWKKTLSTQEIQNSIKRNPSNIKYVVNPDIELQKFAVEIGGVNAISNIQNPPEEVQLLAINVSPYSIRQINKPTENAQLLAVRRDGHLLNALLDKKITPSEQVQIAAVTQNGSAVRYLFNHNIQPSDKVQIAAIRSDINTINWIQKPSEAVQIAAIDINPAVVEYFNRKSFVLSDRAQEFAVRKNPSTIQYLINPTSRARALAKELGSDK